MKTRISLVIWFGITVAATCACGQGSFQNLNFEAANGLPSVQPDQPVQVAASNAFPSWTIYVGVTNQQAQVFYNGVSAGSALVTLIGPNTANWSNIFISGNYTATLDAGEWTGFPTTTSAAIAQTGIIPVTAQSLRFAASLDISGFLTVTVNGQNVPYYPLSAGPNYEVYGGDISAFAGQTAELRFTENPTASDPFAIAGLDNIVFSTAPIPEPCVWALMLCGAGLLGVNRWRRRQA